MYEQKIESILLDLHVHCYIYIYIHTYIHTYIYTSPLCQNILLLYQLLLKVKLLIHNIMNQLFLKGYLENIVSFS